MLLILKKLRKLQGILTFSIKRTFDYCPFQITKKITRNIDIEDEAYFQLLLISKKIKEITRNIEIDNQTYLHFLFISNYSLECENSTQANFDFELHLFWTTNEYFQLSKIPHKSSFLFHFHIFVENSISVFSRGNLKSISRIFWSKFLWKFSSKVRCGQAETLLASSCLINKSFYSIKTSSRQHANTFLGKKTNTNSSSDTNVRCIKAKPTSISP